jgi:hypothetical protein
LGNFAVILDKNWAAADVALRPRFAPGEVRGRPKNVVQLRMAQVPGRKAGRLAGA